MPLFDKVKAQATQLAQKAQEAGKAGQAKLEEVQAKRKADGILRELGTVVYAARASDGVKSLGPKVAELISLLEAHEAEYGTIEASSESDTSE